MFGDGQDSLVFCFSTIFTFLSLRDKTMDDPMNLANKQKKQEEKEEDFKLSERP
jgi:hypothetical protein